ncbi:MAG: ABC transporter permease [Planctomycetaceae bacterium]
MFAFALKTLLSDRGKLITALIGVVFSLILVCVQGGLYSGLMQKASLLVDECNADIWVCHRHIELVDLPKSIPTLWRNRIRGLEGVEQAEPYIVGNAYASLPNSQYENVWIMGSDPTTKLGGGWAFVEGDHTRLLRPHGITVDALDAERLGNPQINDTLEINGHRARVVAKTWGIAPFTTTPYLFTSLNNARQYTKIPDSNCSYILVRAKAGTDLRLLQERIRQRIPDADVYTSAEFSQISRDYWMTRTGIGISFGAATLLGVLVGMLMVGQSLYALALDHLDDYATLKAIGADDRQIRSVVIAQALSIAAVGSAVGIAMVVLIERNWSSPLAPIEIPFDLLCGSVALVFGICLLATILPAHRIRRIDPATVLQG